MNRKVLAIVIIGHAIVIIGIFFTLYFGIRVFPQRSQHNFSFTGYHRYEPKTNATYLQLGHAYFYDCYGDRIEVVDVRPPKDFAGSLQDICFFVWEPSIGAEGTSPTKILELDGLNPSYCVNEDTVYFELVADESEFELLGGASESWTVDFVLFHTENNISLSFIGVFALSIGIAVNIVGLAHKG